MIIPAASPKKRVWGLPTRARLLNCTAAPLARTVLSTLIVDSSRPSDRPRSALSVSRPFVLGKRTTERGRVVASDVTANQGNSGAGSCLIEGRV
jgi:hypothetical protein